MFPHPEMPHLNKKMKPLDFNKFQINKKNSLLFLSLIRSVTPATIEDMAEVVDEFFEDDLSVRPEKEEEYKAIIEDKNEFFVENGLDANSLSEMQQDIYVQSQMKKIMLCEVDEVYFTSKNTPLLASLQKQSKKRKKEQADEKEQISKELSVLRSKHHKLEDAFNKWDNYLNEATDENIEYSQNFHV